MGAFQTPIVEQPGGDQDERSARGSLRAEAVRDLAADDPRSNHDGREDEEHQARAVHPELPRVEGGERAEPGEAEHGEGEDEAGPDSRRVDESRGRERLADCSHRPCLRKREPDGRGDEAEGGREQPDGVEVIFAEHELAENRTEREPAPETEAVQAEGLPTALRRRDVGDHGRGADEEHRLADPCEEPKRDERAERVRERIQGDAQPRDQRTRHDEDAAALTIPDPSGDRLEEEEHRADRGDRERHAEASGAELVVRVHGQDHEQHPDRHAQRELREHGEDERSREDSIGLHARDPSRTPRSDRLLEAASCTPASTRRGTKRAARRPRRQ